MRFALVGHDDFAPGSPTRMCGADAGTEAPKGRDGRRQHQEAVPRVGRGKGVQRRRLAGGPRAARRVRRGPWLRRPAPPEERPQRACPPAVHTGHGAESASTRAAAGRPGRPRGPTWPARPRRARTAPASSAPSAYRPSRSAPRTARPARRRGTPRAPRTARHRSRSRHGGRRPRGAPFQRRAFRGSRIGCVHGNGRHGEPGGAGDAA